MGCSICSKIPDTLTANTGREHYLPETTSALQPLEWGNRDQDLWQCPECKNLYTYYSEQSWTGSGNNDDDHLARLTPEQAHLVRAVGIPGAMSLAEIARNATAIFALPAIALSAALKRAYAQNREVVRSFIPQFVDNLARGQGDAYEQRDTLLALAKARKDDARRILDEIAKHTFAKGHPLAWVKDNCELALR